MRPIIAKRVQEARERCGLSQQELANLMGVNTSLIAIENGSHDVKTWEILKLANIMKVLPESLYNEGVKIPELPVILWKNKASDQSFSRIEVLDMFQHYEDYQLIKRLLGETSSTIKELDQVTLEDADNQFLQLAYLAYEKGRLSKARLARMLKVKLRDVDQYMSERGLNLTNEIEANILD